jgi:hypothetical protein
VTSWERFFREQPWLLLKALFQHLSVGAEDNQTSIRIIGIPSEKQTGGSREKESQKPVRTCTMCESIFEI